MALGVHMGAVKGAKAQRYMEVARGITRTCYEMYNRTATGAPPALFQRRALRVVNLADTIICSAKSSTSFGFDWQKAPSWSTVLLRHLCRAVASRCGLWTHAHVKPTGCPRR